MKTVTRAHKAPPTSENCRFCWMCRHVCPVGHVTSRETFTPHAWALTIESVKRGQLSWNAETGDVLYACADCGLCQTHCVTDQALPDAVAAARAAAVAAGAAPAAVAEIGQALETHANPYGIPAPAPTRARGPVALFVGDVAFHRRPAVFEAAMRLLGAAGTEVVPVGVGRSNGAIASSLGLHETAGRLALSLIDEIRATGCGEVLVLAAADRWAFEKVYPTRLNLAWPAGVTVRTVTAVLAAALADGRVAFTARGDASEYAYHDGCHSTRVSRDRSARELLGAAFRTGQLRELFWREERAHPCGATSGLEFTHPAIARLLAEARLRDATEAGARRVVSDDPACVTHLAEVGSREVVGLFELLADRLAGGV